jgi:hypothetical protein
MQTREETFNGLLDCTTHCVPDKLNGWQAAISSTSSGDSTWWYVHLGLLGHEAISVDDDAWVEFVAFVNELDSLVKEKFGA